MELPGLASLKHGILNQVKTTYFNGCVDTDLKNMKEQGKPLKISCRKNELLNLTFHDGIGETSFI